MSEAFDKSQRPIGIVMRNWHVSNASAVFFILKIEKDDHASIFFY